MIEVHSLSSTSSEDIRVMRRLGQDKCIRVGGRKQTSLFGIEPLPDRQET